MKNTFKFFAVALVLSILCISLGGCFSSGDYVYGYNYKIDGESLELVGTPTLKYELDEEYGEYTAKVEGYVKNISKDDRTNCYISFVIYDSEGNTISTASGYCEYLESGSVWRFCAVGYSSFEPSSIKLISLY